MMVLEVKATWGQHPVRPYLFQFKYLVTFLVTWEEEATMKSGRVEIGKELLSLAAQTSLPVYTRSAIGLIGAGDKYP